MVIPFEMQSQAKGLPSGSLPLDPLIGVAQERPWVLPGTASIQIPSVCSAAHSWALPYLESCAHLAGPGRGYGEAKCRPLLLFSHLLRNQVIFQPSRGKNERQCWLMAIG